MNYRCTYPPSHRSSKPRPPTLRNFVQHDDDNESDESDYRQDAAFPHSDPSDDADNNDDDEDYYTGRHRGAAFESSSHRSRNPKKRRVEDLSPNYEFRPRGVPHPIRAEWNEHSTSALLDCWGERFLQLGRSSLRSEDWIEVSERVSEATGFDFGVSECRGRLNVLRNKYRKEKAKSEAVGGVSMWGYYKKMDMLMTLPARQERQCGLACGVDSGEFVFMNPRVYLEHSNAMDEMRDSPGSSEEEDEGEEDEEEEVEDLESYRVLSESIKRVGEIYEKIEDSKRHHMMELESMRMEFERDLELQKKEMLERTRAEIERIRQSREEDEEDEEEDEEEDGDCSPDTTDWDPLLIKL